MARAGYCQHGWATNSGGGTAEINGKTIKLPLSLCPYCEKENKDRQDAIEWQQQADLNLVKNNFIRLLQEDPGFITTVKLLLKENNTFQTIEQMDEKDPMNLNERIKELEQLRKNATPTPWWKGDVYKDSYDQEMCPVGPYDMADKIDKNPFEDTIADFWGGEHDCEANAKFAIAAVNAVPILIARIRELEQENFKLTFTKNTFHKSEN